ncbi:unnamed protein product [Diamesa serratosioi]
MAGGSSTKVVQITNIAPQATKDQMQSLFGNIGKIEEIRLYPTIRDVTCPVVSRICYVKYQESNCVAVAQHMTNTVFIDRALIVIPVGNSVIPDEYKALEMSHSGTLVPGFPGYSQDSKLPAEVVNRIDGMIPNQVVKTYDPKLDDNNLPEYPALPVNFDARKIEETRRTILVLNVEDDWRLEDLMDHFKRAGEVKYSRYAETDNRQRIAMIEFVEQKSVIYALKQQGSYFQGVSLNIHHSTQPITKPEAKSNEAAQREIEEAMSIVKEAQNMISAAIDPVIGILSSKDKGSSSRRHSRSRTRSRERRSPSHTSKSHSRKRSRSRKRSTSRRRKRSTSRKRTRSRSKSRSRERKRSRSRDRKRSRSRDRRRRRDKKHSRESRRRGRESRSRSRSRRSRSRERKRSRSRHRSERENKKRHARRKDERKRESPSRSKSNSRRSPSRTTTTSTRTKRRNSRSSERKLKKISEERVRDYDEEEKIGNMDENIEKSSSKSDNMDISP